MFVWLLILIAYFPFQAALNPMAGFDLASLRLLIVLFFLVWLVRDFWSRKIIKQAYWANLGAAGLLLFLIWAIFSLLGAKNVFWGIRKIVFFLSLFPLYFLVIALVKKRVQIKRVIQVLVFSAAIFAFIGLLQFLAPFVWGLENVYYFWAINIVPIFSGFNFGALILAYPSWLVNLAGRTTMRAFSLFSDPHMFSFYLGVTLPLLAALLLVTKKPAPLAGRPAHWRGTAHWRGRPAHWRGRPAHWRGRQIWFWVAYLIIFTGLLLSFSRGAYIAIIISFVFLITFFYKYSRKWSVIWLLGLSLLIFIIPGTPISQRFYSSFDLSEGSNLGRLEMWQEASRIGLNSPWRGLGLGNYFLAVDGQADYRNPITAHNFYLDIFSELGLFGLFVWLGLILGSLIQLLKAVYRENCLADKAVLIGLIGSLVYFSVHSFFETAIYQPSVLALLLVVLGLTNRAVLRKE